MADSTKYSSKAWQRLSNAYGLCALATFLGTLILSVQLYCADNFNRTLTVILSEEKTDHCEALERFALVCLITIMLFLIWSSLREILNRPSNKEKKICMRFITALYGLMALMSSMVSLAMAAQLFCALSYGSVLIVTLSEEFANHGKIMLQLMWVSIGALVFAFMWCMLQKAAFEEAREEKHAKIEISIIEV